MKAQVRVRPTLEQLEHRWCPSVFATLTDGVLTVTGAATNAGDTIAVKETAASTFVVDDGATPVSGSPFANVSSVKVNLGSADDIVNADLGGFTLTGDLYVKLGNGANSLTVGNGTVGGHLNAYGGTGKDEVTLGAASTTTNLTVTKSAYVDLDGGSNDVLSVKSTAFSSYLTTEAVNAVTLDANSTVAKALIDFGGNSGNSLDLEGSVGGDVALINPLFFGNEVASSSLTVGATASIGGDLTFINSLFGNAHNSTLTTLAGSNIAGDVYYVGSGKGDTVDFAGSIGGEAELYLRNGANKVTFEASSVVSGEAEFFFGNGSNSLTLAGTIGSSSGTGPQLTVVAGNGGDTVTLLGTAVVNGDASVKLGSGVNTLDLRDAATFTGTLTATGGGNAGSTFIGSVQPNHQSLNITGFPVINGNPNP